MQGAGVTSVVPADVAHRTTAIPQTKNRISLAADGSGTL
jgi:hypothetical protein